MVLGGPLKRNTLMLEVAALSEHASELHVKMRRCEKRGSFFFGESNWF